MQSSWRRLNFRKSRNKLQSWISTDLESLCLELELGPSTRRSYSFECPLVDIHVKSWYVQEGALGYAREIRQLAGLSRAAGHESWRRRFAGALLHYASHEQKGSGFRVEPFTHDNWWDCVRAAGAYSDQAGSSWSHSVLELGHFSWWLMIMLLMWNSAWAN